MLVCEICGYKAKQLHQHIKSVHNISSNDYRIVFGMDKVMQFGFTPSKTKIINQKISLDVKKGYNNIFLKLNEIKELFTIEETIQLLYYNDFYLNLFGKAKNRFLIKTNPKLYKSIIYNTRNLEIISDKLNLNKSFFSFSNRIIFLTKFSGNIELLKCKCKKTYTFTGYCRRCPDIKRNQLGKLHTDDEKRKIRLGTINYLSSINGQLFPRYNKNSIKIIEEYGKLHNFNFQHAENGGEFYIKELGYWVDGYDKENNVIIEIDECHHYDPNGNLKQKDLIRQYEIEKLLNCKFIRIKYDT